MRLNRILVSLTLIILTCLSPIDCFGSSSVQGIRGEIVGYVWDTMLIVRTKKEFVILRKKSSGMNLIPEAVLRERRIWNFAAVPSKDCSIPMPSLRHQPIMLMCGNEYPLDKPEQETPKILIPYWWLSFVKKEFIGELDKIGDETVLKCYDVDFGKSKPSYRERILSGVVLNDNNVPIPEFPVSVGFSNAKVGYIFVLTDREGRFSIPVFENFSYWIKAGRTGFVGQREYRGTFIPKKRSIPPLTLRLEFE